jgi:hypothetical protein
VKQLVPFSLILFNLAISAYAANINAASCSSTDVQNAINSAVNGDTVIIPSCPSGVTWSSSVTIPNTKGMTLQGAGVGNTVIVDGTANSVLIISVKDGNALTRVTGISFNGNETTKNGTAGEIEVNASSDAHNAIRIDHNHFYMMGHRGIPFGMGGHEVSGVIDHNSFDKPQTYPVQALSIFGAGTEDGTPFSRPYAIGSANFIFIEDNTFNYTGSYPDGALDAYGGAGFVFRHNTINGTYIGWHGLDSGDYRGIHSYEIYSNTFSNTNAAIFITINSRSGSGVVWDNTVTGNYNGDRIIEFNNYRSCASYAPWGQCNGTSAWDQNLAGQNGAACRDQTGHTFGPTSGGSQTATPVYAWNNIKNGSETDANLNSGECTGIGNYLQADREWYNYTSSFDGTSGMGRGLLSASPSTCSTLTAYFATDTNTLYQCDSTHHWAAYYTPYTYPHPLQSGSLPPAPPTGPPAPPTGLTGVVH